MSFQVRINRRQAGQYVGDGYELNDPVAGVRAEVWPHCGFNCLRWQVRQADGHWVDLLYASPDWQTNPLPTRSGHPILFPFPGRLRDGRFQFEGRWFQLPLTDSTHQHAIHGFTPRHPWRVMEWGGDHEHGFITARFHLATELPVALDHWPCDFQLDVTYRLFRNQLRVEATVLNVGTGNLPFGLGYHGYFQLPGLETSTVDEYILKATPSEVWEATENLPTGKRIPIPSEIDFRQPRPIGLTHLDHVYVGMSSHKQEDAGNHLRTLAVLSHPCASGTFEVRAHPDFLNLVLFTPPHRHAIAIEPYTCSADAPNLANQGIPTGWKVLPPGETWRGEVVYEWRPKLGDSSSLLA
jgi:aldose 1-epimerase